jgi:hypothetical protein
MSPVPIFPTNTQEIKTLILDQIGRDVVFYTVYSSEACPNPLDSLDPVTNESTWTECPTCFGEYYIPHYSGTTFKAHVTWKYSDQTDWETVGKFMIGDCQIKVMISGNIDSIVHSAAYVIVDETTMDIEKITYRGVTVLDRMIVDLKERSKP